MVKHFVAGNRWATAALALCFLLAAATAEAQYRRYPRYPRYPSSTASEPQADLAFGVGSLISPDAASADFNHSPQTMGGGAYLSFSGDYLFAKQFGIEGEVAWRASRNLYQGFQPFRPIFYNFNAIYAPRLGPNAQLELLGGLGGVSTRFYSDTLACDVFTCTNYVSVTHLTGDVGIGLKLYLGKGWFLRPEFRQYFIHDNREFSSAYSSRAGVSLGYTFGR